MSEVGLPPASYVTFAPPSLPQIREALSSGRAWEGKASCRRRTGDTVRLDTKIIPLVNAGGNPARGANGGKGQR